MSIVPRPKPTILFSPIVISNCAVWFDASDLTTFSFSSGSNISTWADKSGNGRNMSVFATSYPVLTGNAQNGRSVITFGGVASQYLTTASNVMSVYEHTRFLVYSNSVNVVGQAVLNSDGSIFLQNGGGTAYQDNLGWPSATGDQGPFQTGSTYRIGEAVVTTTPNTSGEVYFNGTLQTPFFNTAGSSPSQSTRMSIGSRGDVGFTGTVAECVVYNRVLSTNERKQIEGYLAQKWGLTSSLPSGHPGLTQTIYGSLVSSTISVPIVLIPYNIYTNYNPLTATGSTCILWLDASDPTTLFSDAAGTTPATANGTVGYWKDKSSSAFNATQITLSYRPTYLSAARNGKSILSFNEATNFLNLPQFTAVPLTIFFVAQESTFISGTYFLTLGAAGASIKMRSLSSPATYGVDGITAISTTNSDTNWHLWTLTISSSTAIFYFDGTLVGTSSWANGSSYSFATNTIAALNQQVVGLSTTINMPEILFYSAVLATPQQQQVEAYLTEKWGIKTPVTRSVASIVSISKHVYVQYTQIFTYTGVNQTFVVPATTTSITVYMWGAGGAGGYSGVGGAGAFLGGVLSVTPSSSLTVIVGQGGTVNGTSAFGGGGIGSVGSWTGGGGGGGYSGIFNSSTPLAIVGAGGGAAFYSAVGGCGDSVTGTGIRGTTNGSVQSGYGGTQSAGGAGGSGGLANGSSGSYLHGGAGDPSWSAGGGSGYYGGGGGGTDNSIGGSGAGGSSYSTLLTNIVASNSPNTGMNAPNTSSTYYASGIAVGGSGYNVVGGDGRVVFVYTA
jgi:hypothetical protein